MNKDKLYAHFLKIVKEIDKVISEENFYLNYENKGWYKEKYNLLKVMSRALAGTECECGKNKG